jgi:antitoxin HicB
MSMTEREIVARARELGRRGYHYVLRGDPENGYLIEVPDLPGCSTGSNDLSEAFAGLQEAIDVWIETALDLGQEIPPPSRPMQSRPMLVHVPEVVYQALVDRAESMNMRPEQFASVIVTNEAEHMHGMRGWVTLLGGRPVSWFSPGYLGGAPRVTPSGEIELGKGIEDLFVGTGEPSGRHVGRVIASDTLGRLFVIDPTPARRKPGDDAPEESPEASERRKPGVS